MGLGTSRRHADQSNPTVLEALVEQRLVEDVFSLCIGALRGTLTFGMPQLGAADGTPASVPASLFWTGVVESTYYGVEVTAIMLGEQAPRPASLPSSAPTLRTQAATQCTQAPTLRTQALGPASLPSSSIVDSGTTFMYLHSPVRRVSESRSTLSKGAKKSAEQVSP